jgi:hypothetical protein
MKMDKAHPARPTNYAVLCSIIVLLLGGGVGYGVYKDRAMHDSTLNFALTYPKSMSGWRPREHGPQTLFLYEQPNTGLLLRGAVNQMVSDVNPTPNLDRDNLAQLMVDNTHDNMPGWTAVVEDKVDAKGTSFRLVRRSQRGQVVVTAFAVKGNTTVLISLSGRDQHVADVDKGMDDFRKFISSLALTKTDLSRL